MSEASPSLKGFRIFKLIAVQSHYNLKGLPINKGLQTILQLSKIFLLIILYLHFIGCYYYSVIVENKDKVDADGLSLQWYPAGYFLNYQDSKLFTDEMSVNHKYLQMLYTACLFIGINEMGPVNQDEMFACMIILVFSSFFSAIVISDLIMLVDDLLLEQTDAERI